MAKLLFKYIEDAEFFAELFGITSGVLENQYSDLFDFRNPSQKRKEISSVRRLVLPDLIARSRGLCEICRKAAGTEVDHRVPLSTNYLSKKLRNLKGSYAGGKRRKAPSESYGSNNLANLQLVCKVCNRKKWQQLLPLGPNF